MRFHFESIEDPSLLSGGGEASFLRCDTCGDRVDSTEPAIVVFKDDADRKKTGEVLVIHKGRCDTDVTKALRWQDLDLFLRDVIKNAGIDLASVETRIDEEGGLADFGLHR